MKRMVSLQRSQGGLGRAMWVGLLAAAIAAIANVVVYTLARAMGVTLAMPMEPGASATRLPLALVLVMSAIGALVATSVFILLVRFVTPDVRLFQIVGGLFLLLSFAMPLSLSFTDGATKATLLLMHVVEGIVMIGLLSRLGQSINGGTRTL